MAIKNGSKKFIFFISGGPFNITLLIWKVLVKFDSFIYFSFPAIPEEVTETLVELEEGAMSGSGADMALLGVVGCVAIFFLLLCFLLICLGRGKFCLLNDNWYPFCLEVGCNSFVLGFMKVCKLFLYKE
jgi:hypothetical protein